MLEPLCFDQSLSREQLAAYQLAAFNKQLAYARANSSFYGAWPAGVGSLAEVAALPFTDSRDILERGQELVCVSASRVRRIVTLITSGTTAAKRLYFTGGDLERTVEFFRVGMGWMTGPGQRALICMPGSTPDGIGDLLARGLSRLGARPLIYGPISDYEHCARIARDFGPQVIIGLPAQMRRLALMAPDIRPQRALLSADYIAESLADTIIRCWGSELFSHYGLTESGYGGAVDCHCHQGMHIRHDELLVEVVDPDSGQPLPAGSWGEIVLSTLRREAMPLLRFRTGDQGRLLDSPCPCGSVLPRLDRVRGRLIELACRPSLYQLDEALLGVDDILNYQASLGPEGLELTVESRRSLDELELPPLPIDRPVRLISGAAPLVTGQSKRALKRY